MFVYVLNRYSSFDESDGIHSNGDVLVAVDVKDNMNTLASIQDRKNTLPNIQDENNSSPGV